MKLLSRYDLLMPGVEWQQENSSEGVLKLIEDLQTSETLGDSHTFDAAEYARAAVEAWLADTETTSLLEANALGVEAVESDEFREEYLEIVTAYPDVTPIAIVEHIVVSHALKRVLSDPV